MDVHFGHIVLTTLLKGFRNLIVYFSIAYPTYLFLKVYELISLKGKLKMFYICGKLNMYSGSLEVLCTSQGDKDMMKLKVCFLEIHILQIYLGKQQSMHETVLSSSLHFPIWYKE